MSLPDLARYKFAARLSRELTPVSGIETLEVPVWNRPSTPTRKLP